MNRIEKPMPNSLSGERYSALRNFLRGYFHQDMKDEYGSAEKAARQFCSDAGSEERAAVAKQWLEFINQTREQPLDEVNRRLTGSLGSSYSLSRDDLDRVSAVLQSSQKSDKT